MSDNSANPTPPATTGCAGRLFVDAETCIGCGICVSVAPDIFEIQASGKSHVLPGEDDDSTRPEGEEALQACPVGAIKRTK